MTLLKRLGTKALNTRTAIVVGTDNTEISGGDMEVGQTFFGSIKVTLYSVENLWIVRVGRSLESRAFRTSFD